MSQSHRRILWGCLLTVVLGSGWLIAQDKPEIEIKITPRKPATESETQPAKSDETFSPTPAAPSGGSVIAVSRLLAEADKTYQSGDLLTWEMVKPVLARLRRARVPMPPEREMQARFLSQNDPLVKMLSTKDGKAFFSQLGKNPASIDMVDHYRTLPYGNQFLDEFIHDVDGYKFFTTQTWMTPYDAKWAENNTLANVPGGNQFGKPTGRIYLETQLIQFLAAYAKSGGSRVYE